MSQISSSKLGSNETPWTAAWQASLSFIISQSLLKLKSWVSDAIQPSHPLSPPSPHAPNLSWHQSLFQWVSSSHQVAKTLELQLQHQSFQWIFRVISSRIDWFDLLAVQEMLKSILQHHSLKASVLQSSEFWSNSCIHTWLLEKP